MKYYVYILYSLKLDAFYKGQTNDVFQRLERHNAGMEDFTSSGIPWKIVWYCEKPNRKEAIDLERKLKNLSRRRTKEFILKYKEDSVDPGS